MSGDDNLYPNGDDQSEFDDIHRHASGSQGDQPPASVIFMQMMRQAAANHHDKYLEAPQPYTSPTPHPPGLPQTQASSGQLEQPIQQATAEPAPDPAYTDAEEAYRRKRAAAMDSQRQRREIRRKERRRQQTVGLIGGLFRALLVVVISGGLIATILSWGTSPQSLDAQLRAQLQQANATEPPVMQPTVQPTPNWLRRIGIISGHRGPENDPGAVCPDGLTENELNFAVAQLVVLELRGHGYSVDLLEEFDSRLQDYQGAALVSIHSNDCTDYGGEFPSGFLVAQAEARPVGGEDTRLAECVAEHYGAASQLEQRFGLTRDMTDYHVFREINITTPGVILELGFMLADRQLLETRPDLLARGVVDGILCFLEPGDPTPTPGLSQPTLEATAGGA